MSQLIYLLDSIDWSSLSNLQLCSEKLRTKINNLEDAIPENIDDDWFSLPFLKLTLYVALLYQMSGHTKFQVIGFQPIYNKRKHPRNIY
jgi:hypothetical protein